MKRTCPVCRSKNVHVTSATPGDGRRKFVCQCGHEWTEGKRPMEGYKR